MPDGVCPECQTAIPDNPPTPLRRKLAAAENHLAEVLANNRDPMMAQCSLCRVHKECVNSAGLYEEARKNGWDANMNFRDIPGLLTAFKSSLDSVVRGLNKNFFWKRLKGKFEQFGMKKALKLSEATREPILMGEEGMYEYVG